MARHELFTTIRTEGALLPLDVLEKISSGSGIPGINPEDYHLQGEKMNEAITRAWNRLVGLWAGFMQARAKLPENDIGTTITREKWLLPLFQELCYGRLRTSTRFTLEGKDYPVSHIWEHTPIHLVGCRIELDKKTIGVAGAARMSPHGLVQEFLNRSDEHLWAFVSNGLKLRILRDNASLTRQAYVEFDLEAMMEGEVYTDFTLLWLVCHQSRVEAEKPEECWLEKWMNFAHEQGTRALDKLRDGVMNAITKLGSGFLSCQGNRTLRENLHIGKLSTQDYYRQLLRLAYRLIFIFVAEDRDALLSPSASREIRELYYSYYSTIRLRRLAQRRRGSKHTDLWKGFCLVMDKLCDEKGCPELGLSPLGSFLWTPAAVPDIAGCNITNHDFLEALRSLAFTADRNILRPIDYRNLGAEELGSVYESLLELYPDLNTDAGTFELKTAGGSERKTTGSYYTPTSLIQCLLESALDPVLDEAAKNKEAEKAILNLKVCDPACGSGHFLVAAAHRIARKLASVRTGGEEPSPADIRKALRDVIGRCIYGVDINPMSVELCKVSLWMEALEPGKPLSFLEHHIQCGNSLLGTTPRLLKEGIPDEAFTPIEGDDKELCKRLKKKNKEERSGQMDLFSAKAESMTKTKAFSSEIVDLDNLQDDTIDDIHRKEKEYEKLIKSTGFKNSRLLADAWCAAFVWKKQPGELQAIKEEDFRRIENCPDEIPVEIMEAIWKISEQYKFFHWHLAFPEAFRLPEKGEKPENVQTGWSGGFDVVLGNPPWERIKLQEKEWFAVKRPDIANAPNAAQRRKMIEALKTEDAVLYNAFLDDRRGAEGESHLVRTSNRYPLCGRGDVNTYAVLAELKLSILHPGGRVGCIVPSGIATDDTTKFFFQDLMEKKSLVSIYDFENREKLFPAVDSRMKFCLLTLTGSGRPSEKGAQFVFYAYNVQHTNERRRRFTLSAEDIALLNPNTKTCPIFRSSKDAELTKSVYRRVPVLIDEGPPEINPWHISFLRMVDMANDSHLFRKKEQLKEKGFILERNIFIKESERYLPLYEAKMIHHFSHRFGDYGDQRDDSKDTSLPDISINMLSNPEYEVLPRYWISYIEAKARITQEWKHQWFAGFRDITNTTNERTVIASFLPFVAVGHTCPLIFPPSNQVRNLPLLISNLASFILDYTARQKIGGTHLTYGYLKQLPVLPPEIYDQPCQWQRSEALSAWILPRVLELTYTAWDLEPFAKDCGYDGPPFRWDEERRFLMRCELDAAYFHFYGIERDDVDYIMETFPIVKRKDEQKHGEYRTKRVILEIYDRMKEGMDSGKPYETLIDPPPADPRVAHPPRKD